LLWLLFVSLLQGRVVSFKNAIIIMTSNLGSAEIFNHAYKAQQHKAASQEAGMRAACTWLNLATFGILLSCLLCYQSRCCCCLLQLDLHKILPQP
jgi:hypothetical protein